MSKYFSFAVLLGCLAAFEASGQDVTNGLIGYYPFDGNANDLSGKGLHGTVNGATLAEGINGEANTCYDFTSGSIDIFHNITIPDSNFTMSVWLYPDTNINLGGWEQYYFSLQNHKDDVKPVSNFNVISEYDASTNSKFFAPACTLSVCSSNDWGNGCLVLSIENSIKSNEWNHLVYEFSKDSLTIYLNDQVFKIRSNKLIKYSIIYSHSIIGAKFPGKIDELMMFDRKLSAAERNLLYRKKKLITSTQFLNNSEIDIFYDNSQNRVNVINLNGIIKKVELIDISGKVVLTDFPYEPNLSIETSHVNSGIYIVKVETEKSMLIQKVLIKN